MRTDALDSLRRCDPAAAAGFSAASQEDRQALVRAITAGPFEGAAERLRRRRRRLVLIAVTAAALLLLAATAVYAGSYLLDPIAKGPNPPMSGREWRAEYEAWTQKIPLPPGEHWRGFLDPEMDPDHVSTSVGAGALGATFEAMGHWTKAWVAAAAAGDTARAYEAQTWVTRLLNEVPAITDQDTKEAYGSEYGTESMAGMDEAGHRYEEQAIEAASRGHFGKLIRQTVGATYWPAPVATPSPTHYHGMDSQGDSGTLMMSADEAWAEYQDVLSRVGTPPGLDVERARREVFGSGATYFGGGFERGFEDAWAAWWREWARAARAGDEEGVAAASEATRRLQDLLPHTIAAHGREETYFYSGDPRRDLAQFSERARRGDMSGIEEWLAFQDWYRRQMRSSAGFDELKVIYDGPAHPVVWDPATAADAEPVPAAAAEAEYAAAQRLIDLPEGVSWPQWSSAGAGATAELKAGVGYERAVDFAWLSWWRAWIAAGDAGDQAGVARAETASRRIRTLLAGGLPLADGRSPAASAETLRDFGRLDARARSGDLDGLLDWSLYQAVSAKGIGTDGK